MKKEFYIEVNDELRSEYDLSKLLSQVIRGKYAKRIREEGAVMPEANERTGKVLEQGSAGILPGSTVRDKADPRRLGVVTDRTNISAGRRYWQVKFPGGLDFVLGSQLGLVSDSRPIPQRHKSRRRSTGPRM